MSTHIAIIPAAGRGSRMMGLTENNPKPMLPYEGKPIISHTLETLIESGIKEVIIVVGYKKEKLIDYVQKFYKDKIKIRFVEQANLNGLAGAIKSGLEIIEDKSKKVLIVLGDIILKQKGLLKDMNYVGYTNVEDYSRWCMVEANEKGRVEKFYDKPLTKPETNMALMGVYNLTDCQFLEDCIDVVLSSDKKIAGEYQFSQVLEYYLYNKPIYLMKIEKYFDMGEIEDITQTRKNITRHFNSISKTDYGTIVKTSDNTQKIEDEANWYLNLPMRLKMFTPHLVNFDELSYELEYIGSTPIQELYMYDLIDEQSWKNIFSKIETYLDFSHRSDLLRITKNDLMEIYITKTKKRIEEIPEDFKGNKFIIINNIVYKNPLENISQILELAKEKLVDEFNNRLHVSSYHGDLFFGNMFYDLACDSLKIIDPRGSFGARKDNIGDTRYDIAKLNHSINGYYDFIVNELYTFYEDEDGYHYSFYEGKQDVVKKLFNDNILVNFDKDTIDLLTGLLFLTMIPLHSENSKNQKMQFIQATKFLNKFI